MNHYVYEITNLINGKKYIGKRSCKCSIEDDKYMGSGSRLIESQKKYGIENFKKEILEVCETEYDAYQKEIEIMKSTGATTFNQHKYYNLSQGGKGVKPGHDLYVKMLPIYKEGSKIAAKSNTGEKSYRSRKVVLLNTGEIFGSMGEARRKHGERIYATQITNNCKNPKSSGGYLRNGEPARWMYYEDYILSSSKAMQNKSIIEPTKKVSRKIMLNEIENSKLNELLKLNKSTLRDFISNLIEKEYDYTFNNQIKQIKE